MASLGQLTAGIAHEIKNPLNFVNNFASLSVELLDELKEVAAPALAALDEDKRDELDETIELLTGNLEKIAEHGRRADNIVKSMLEHSRGVSGERREVDLNALVEEALNLAYHGARAQDQSFNITLERDSTGRCKPIELVPQDMTRVLPQSVRQRLLRGQQAGAHERRCGLPPGADGRDARYGRRVEVRVRDNGTGIPPDIRDKLFQPFFTTKPTGEGTGLGLSISYDIVTQQHGGTITVESEGRPSPSSPCACRAISQTLGKKMSVSILVVDDEPDVADLFRQRFRREARQGTYVMHFAASGERRWIIRRAKIEPQLIVILSDINMPGMDGLDAAARNQAAPPRAAGDDGHRLWRRRAPPPRQSPTKLPASAMMPGSVSATRCSTGNAACRMVRPSSP
jgi:signal transduction histidine kinase